MADWNSDQYLKFKDQRTQPAVDLATRIAKRNPKRIADIGCGPGNSTAVLKEFFPDAELLGVDSSQNMVERARAEHPDLQFRLCDAAALEDSYDLLFSNACLQWIPDHDTLIPLLMGKLREPGVLAVQIPMNDEEPLFRIIRETARDPKWGLQNVPLQPNEVLTPEEYVRILSGCSSDFEVWETKYYHRLPSHEALVEWVKGTRIRPYLEHLGQRQGAAFEREIMERSGEQYPVTGRGEVLLGFRRFFFTAIK